MRKLLSITIIILCVSMAIFADAGATVKVGGAVDLFRIKTASDSDSIPMSEYLKGVGFGFDVGAQYDMSDNVFFFSDFNIVFFNDVDFKLDDPAAEWTTIRTFYGRGKTDEIAFNFWSASIGVAYRLKANGPLRIALGGGLTYDRFWCNMKSTTLFFSRLEMEQSFGFTGYIEGKYMLTTDMAIALTVKPQICLFGHHTTEVNGKPYTANSFALSFAAPVVLGLAYSF